MSQTSRIQYIIRALVQKGGVTLASVATYFEVSTRQVARDIEYLRDQLDAPIEYSRKEHKYLLSGPWNSYANLDERMIIMGAYMKSLLENMPLGSVIEGELKNLLMDGMSSKAKRVVGKVIYRTPSIDMPNYNVFSAVTESLAQGFALSISYRNLNNELTHRITEPERLINYEGSWYMVAFDHRRGELRTFHLSRIEEFSLLADRKKYRDEEEIDNYLSGSFGIFLGRKTTLYTIRFYSYAAIAVASQVWHEKQTIVKDADNSLLLTLPAGSADELINRILSFGENAVPVAPESFVLAYRSRVEKMWKRVKKIKQ